MLRGFPLTDVDLNGLLSALKKEVIYCDFKLHGKLAKILQTNHKNTKMPKCFKERTVR